MRPNISELKDTNQYRELASFHIDETIKYIVNPDGYDKPQEPKKIPSIWALLVLVGIGACFGFFAGSIFMSLNGMRILFSILILFFVLLPFHEWIHGLSFKYFGAKQVGYGVSWKAVMVYAYAQDFPINMRELKIIAVMPFAVISALLLSLIFVIPDYRSSLLLIFLVHTLLCGGDFALIKYAFKNQDKTIYTYDDVLNEKKLTSTRKFNFAGKFMYMRATCTNYCHNANKVYLVYILFKLQLVSGTN
ncbi:MAG: hypothetical protein RLZZ546_1268 [Bacteroidota bacterium]|jgi:hypothetical protein